jgi:nitroreductase
MQNDIKKIIEDATNAPSGENCQPWKFTVQGNTLSVINLPEKDQSLYNPQQKGSYVAHGTLIETVCISAHKYGYNTTITLFPIPHDDTHVADIVFGKNDITKEGHDQLYDAIFTRTTNRKEYTGEKLNANDKKTLINAVIESGNNELLLIDTKDAVKKVGMALGVHEQVLFENKHMHDFFYGHILWNEKDEDKAGGFYIKTLEFLPHQLGAVKLFKSWSMLSLLNKVLGVSKKISKENGEKYARSGTLAAIVMNGTDKEAYINAGRAVQRLWLTATAHNLAVHPCNGITYLKEYIKDTGGKEFSEKHIRLLEDAYKDVVEGFNVNNKTLAFVFRIGKADNPSARTKRLVPEILFIDTLAR